MTKYTRELKRLDFDNYANDYDRSRNKMYLSRVKKVIREEVENYVSVLDVGCGTGVLLDVAYPEYGVGIDKSDKMLKIAESNYTRFVYYNVDIEKTKINEEFDYILLIDVVYYFNDMVKAFKNIRHSCHNSTKVIIISPNPTFNFIINFVRRLDFAINEKVGYPTKSEIISNLNDSGFDVVKSYTILFGVINVIIAK